MKKTLCTILAITLFVWICVFVYAEEDSITLSDIIGANIEDTETVRITLPNNGEEKNISKKENLEKFFVLCKNTVLTKCEKYENAEFEGMYIDALKNDGKYAGFAYITNDGYADKFSLVMSRIPVKAYAFKNADEAEKLMTEIISLTDEKEDKIYSEWAEDYVLKTEKMGICSYLDNTLSATRLEFCEMLYNTLSKIEKMPDESTFSIGVFSDCDSFSVMYLYDIGVIKGISDNEFMPEGKINREQAAAMIYRLAKHLNITGFFEDYRLSSYMFADQSEMSKWAIEAISQLKTAGIMNGTGNDLFEPKEYISLEQSAVLMIKLFDKASMS